MSQAIASPDGRFLAKILADGTCQIIDLPAAAAQRKHFSSSISLAHNVKSVLSQAQFLRWSPEQVVVEHNRPEDGVDDDCQAPKAISWLLLASTHRLLVLEVQIPDITAGYPIENKILADIEFPISNGKISAIDFVCDHNSLLVMFDIAPHATILSLAEAQRDDLPNRKFGTAQSYAISKDARSFAVLVRDKHADLVVVFQSGQMIKSFKAETIDGQGIMWCPDGKPIICVWDSAAHGMKIHFYTAMGHALKQLDILPNSIPDRSLNPDFAGTGVSAIAWSSQAGSRTNTVFAIANGSRQVVARLQNSQSSTVERTSVFEHPAALDGSKTWIWQQVDRHSYQQETGIWELQASGPGDIVLVSISADGQRIASVVEGLANVVLIWQMGQAEPISAMILQKDIRQILWHPSFSTTLTVITTDRTASVRVWYGTESTPFSATTPKLEDVSSSRWEAKWLTHKQKDGDLHLLLMSSMKYYDVGFLGIVEDRLVFDSFFVADKFLQPQDESTLSLKTPSKTGRSSGMLSSSSLHSANSSRNIWLSATRPRTSPRD